MVVCIPESQRHSPGSIVCPTCGFQVEYKAGNVEEGVLDTWTCLNCRWIELPVFVEDTHMEEFMSLVARTKN